MCSGADHPASLEVDRLLQECDVRRQRRSGPGGQHRNKVETGVVIRHRPTGIEASATERRSQEQNRQMAIQRLRRRLALDVRRPVDAARGPSQRWRSRCQGGRITVSSGHDDFPALLAEALDTVIDHDADLVTAARRLGCTRSQLAKLLKIVPEAFQQVNRRRQWLGLLPLK
jgi:hypothetical protein